MTLNYHKSWESLNELEMITSKICSAREILECAINALENHKYSKAEALMYATDEFLQYYLNDFDEKFKTAWNEIIVKLKEEEDLNKEYINDILKEREYYEPTYVPGEQYSEETLNAMCDEAEKQEKSKVKRWVLPVQEVEIEYFISFPDDLLEASGLNINDELDCVDQGDGSFILKKIKS